MKKIVTLVFLAFLSACACSAPDVADTVVTEADVVDNSELRIAPGGGILVTYLEGPDDDEPVDTSTRGQDRFPFLYSQSARQTYCWIGDDTSFQHSLSLQTADGSELVQLSNNQGCLNTEVPAGEASLTLTHDDTDASGHSVFLVPDDAASTSTYRVRTDECRSCDLSGGNLRDMNLDGTDFTGANFAKANLSGANLGGSDLSNADLRDTNLEGAILSGANLSGALFPALLISQSALAETVPPIEETTEADRLFSARLWTYGFEWIPNGYSPDPDTITILSYENGTASPVAAFEMRHAVESKLNILTFSRLSGTVSAEQLDLTLATDAGAIPVTLVESDEDHRSYRFTADDPTGRKLYHRLLVSHFVALEDDQITIQYQRSSQPINRFTNPIQPALNRSDTFALEKIGDDAGTPRNLEEQLRSFFTTLFADESIPHVFNLTVEGMMPTEGMLPPASVPILRLRAVNSSDLDDMVPQLTAAIKDYFALEQRPALDGLLFKIDVGNQDQAPILSISNAVLRTSAVLDL